MSLEIVPVELGPLSNNTYLIADSQTSRAAVIDPAMDSELVLATAKQRGWQIQYIWLTHAHFDHIAGVHLLAGSRTPPLPVSLHPGDLPLYHDLGGARKFGFHVQAGPEPSVLLAHRQSLTIGEILVEVRHTPGHTPGHVVFYAPSAGVVFCGDLIFYGSVGRTDLPGGNHRQLIESIQAQILTLQPHTRLFSGHGPETTVGEEIAKNPFL